MRRYTPGVPEVPGPSRSRGPEMRDGRRTGPAGLGSRGLRRGCRAHTGQHAI
jgi:hypothetical protein